MYFTEEQKNALVSQPEIATSERNDTDLATSDMISTPHWTIKQFSNKTMNLFTLQRGKSPQSRRDSSFDVHAPGRNESERVKYCILLS
jgi:hypothetical protein